MELEILSKWGDNLVADEKLWVDFKSELEKIASAITYSTWLKPLELYKIDRDNCEITIIVPMMVHKNILTRSWLEQIEAIFFDLTGINFNIKFLTPEECANLKNVVDKKEVINIDDYISEDKIEEIKPFETNLKKEFTFDNYVVGDTNKFAKTAAITVAQQPGKVYNPLFIYGKSGIGKTHLMYAIGNYITENSDLKVLYTTSGEFRNDFVSISSSENKEDIMNKSAYFRNKYWDIDVLIIDDIQFLVDAKKTQQEFFQTFEELHNKNKQIIISSDSSPDDLKKLEERLQSRLTWGLAVDVFPPDFDLRCRIFKDKIKSFEFAHLITDEAVEFVANAFDNDVRRLIGSINRIQAYAAIYVPEKIDLEFVREAIGDDINKNIYSNNSIEAVQRAVAEYYELTVEVLKGKKRSKDIAYPRMIAMYLARILTDESFPRIGLEFGGRDHSTVIHAYNTIEKDMKDNRKLKEIIDEIKLKI